MTTLSKQSNRNNAFLARIGYPLLALVVNGSVFAALTFAGHADAEPAVVQPTPKPDTDSREIDRIFPVEPNHGHDYDVSGLDRQLPSSVPHRPMLRRFLPVGSFGGY